MPVEKYHTQRNNRNDPYNTCGNTALANALEALPVWHYEAAGEQLEDTIWRVLREPICQAFCRKRWPGYAGYPERIPGMLAFVGTMFTGREFKSYPCMRADDVRGYLLDGRPVVILGHFLRGEKNSHFVTITGQTEAGVLVADPYGVYPDYTDKHGYEVEISYADLPKWWDGVGVVME